MIDATFAVTQEDVAAFAAHIAKHHAVHRRMRMGFTIALLLTFVALAVVAAVHHVETAHSVVLFVLITLMGILFSSEFYQSYPRHVARSAKRAYSQTTAPAALGPHSLTIDADGLRIANEHARADFKWSGITKVDETREHVFAFIGPLAAFVISKTSLRGATPEAVLDAMRSNGSPSWHSKT